MAGVWSDVPLDIIHLLAKRMTADLSDLVRLGAVCSSWRSHLLENQWLGYAQQLESLVGVSSLHLPKLMFPEVTDYCFDMGTPMNFFDLGTGQTFQLHLPEARGRSCCGSGNGWLVTTNKDTEVHLLNPITREQIRLPSLSSLDVDELGLVGKAIVVGNPCKPGDCTVAAIFPTTTTNQLVITKPGRDNAWTMVATRHMLHSIVHHQGLLYGFSYRLNYVDVWNMNTVQTMTLGFLASPFQHHADLRLFNSYSLEVSGKVFGVARLLQDDNSALGEETLIVVELVDGRRWAEVKDLGDCCLFLGENTSMALSPVPPMSGFRRNCVYISHRRHFRAVDIKERYSMIVYSLDDKSYRPLFFGKLASFLLVPALWVTLNPRMV